MNEKTRKSCEHGPENGKPKFNQTKRRSDNGGSARVDCHIYRRRHVLVSLIGNMPEKRKKGFIMQRKIRFEELWVSIFTDSYWFGRSKGRSKLPRWPILKTLSELAVSFTPIFFPPVFSWSDNVSPYYSFVGQSDVPECFFRPWT